MQADGYFVVFDISQTFYTGWVFGFFPLIITAAGLAGALWFNTAWKRWIGFASLGVAGALTAAILWSQWSLNDRLQSAFRDGRFSVVEGPVRNFVRDYATGKSPQTFEVQGHYFEVWGPTRITPAFRETVGAGGPDLRGRCVRIAFTDQEEILWLGMRQCPAESD